MQALVADELDWLPRTILPPENVVSTYRIDAGEVLAVAPDRVIVAAGAERRIETLSIGILKQVAGLSQPSQQQQQREAQERRMREQDAAAERRFYDYQQQTDEYEYIDDTRVANLATSSSTSSATRRGARSVTRRSTNGDNAGGGGAGCGNKEGIPIVSGAPPPYRRRDADGRLGERPEARPVFDEWVERDNDDADTLPADALMGESGAAPSSNARRQSSSYDPNEDRL